MLDGVRRLLVRFFAVDTRPPEVPIGDSPEVFRASTKHLTYLLAAWAIRQGVMTLSFLLPVVAAIVAIVMTKPEYTWLAWLLGIVFVGGFVVVAFVDYAVIRLDWEMRFYVLTDRALRIREGVLNAREMTLTLANVQDLKVSQGPIQRALGILDVVIETAGGSSGQAGGLKNALDDSHRGVLRGIERSSALHQKIMQRVKQRKGSGLGDPDEHHAHTSAPTTTPAFVAALRELRDEAKRLRAAAGRS